MNLWGKATGAIVIGALVIGCQSNKQHDGHHHDHMQDQSAGESGGGGAGGGPAEHHHMHMWESVTEAIAVIHPTKGNTAHGWVRFTKVAGGLKVTADLDGLTPNGTHGFHIHEFGDCSGEDGSSAGGHYNPDPSHRHAGPDDPMRHAGDLGNVTADASGHAHLEMTADNITIADMKNPIIGRAVIVHAKADDLKSQPAGEAGPRIGCGIIGIAKGASGTR